MHPTEPPVTPPPPEQQLFRPPISLAVSPRRARADPDRPAPPGTAPGAPRPGCRPAPSSGPARASYGVAGNRRAFVKRAADPAVPSRAANPARESKPGTGTEDRDRAAAPRTAEGGTHDRDRRRPTPAAPSRAPGPSRHRPEPPPTRAATDRAATDRAQAAARGKISTFFRPGADLAEPKRRRATGRRVTQPQGPVNAATGERRNSPVVPCMGATSLCARPDRRARTRELAIK
jgi:hypothetical protein